MNDSNRVPQQTRPAPAGRFKPSPRTLIAGAVALALAGGAVLAQVNALDTGPGRSQAQAQAPAMPSFADVAERVSPAVVNVMVVGDGVGSAEVQGLPELPEGAPMDEFFHHFFQQPGPSGPHHTQ